MKNSVLNIYQTEILVNIWRKRSILVSIEIENLNSNFKAIKINEFECEVDDESIIITDNEFGEHVLFFEDVIKIDYGEESGFNFELSNGIRVILSSM